MVTHNMQQAARISDHTAFFLLGDLVEFGDTDRSSPCPRTSGQKSTLQGGLDNAGKVQTAAGGDVPADGHYGQSLPAGHCRGG